MPNRSSLYQCGNAHCQGEKIVCIKGHRFSSDPFFRDNGAISIKRLQRGAPLEYSVCQECPEYDEMGPPVPPKERGWIQSCGLTGDGIRGTS